MDILGLSLITIVAVICGAATWNDIEQYGKSRQSWLSRYLRLPNGIPSHDTFNRFFSALDSDGFEGAFLSWIKDVSSLTDGETASMDGKAIRGSLTSSSKRAVHTVSTRASTSQPGLGQVKVEEKSGEIPIVPKLLKVLALKGCTVTTDSTGCQRATAAEITGKEADYILTVKGNQGNPEGNAEETVHFTKAAEE
jgi:predicted transposase YbfD/YdcC